MHISNFKLFNYNMTKLYSIGDSHLIQSILDQAQVEFMLIGINRLHSTLLVEFDGSFVQQSQRYVKMDMNSIYLAGSQDIPSERVQEGEALINKMMQLYSSMSELKDKSIKGRLTQTDFIHGIPFEDARYILPLSVTTNVKATMSLFEFLRFLNYLGATIFRRNGIFSDLFVQLKKELDLIDRDVFDLFRSLKCVHTHNQSDIFAAIYEDKCKNLSIDNNILLLDVSSDNFDKTVGLSALFSTQTDSDLIDNLRNSKEDSYYSGVVNRVMGYGHKSISEQVSILSALQMSLVTYHQFIRHRLPVNARETHINLLRNNLDYILPPTIKASSFVDEFAKLVRDVRTYRYTLLLEGYTDFALNFLMNCDTIRVVSKTNARMDIDIAKERTCRTAQWEIQNLYEKKIGILMSQSPTIFKDALPSCVYGACKEGKLSCGKAAEVRKYYLGNVE